MAGTRASADALVLYMLRLPGGSQPYLCVLAWLKYIVYWLAVPLCSCLRV
jgi:hypothetical protein